MIIVYRVFNLFKVFYPQEDLLLPEDLSSLIFFVQFLFRDSCPLENIFPATYFRCKMIPTKTYYFPPDFFFSRYFFPVDIFSVPSIFLRKLLFPQEYFPAIFCFL